MDEVSYWAKRGKSRTCMTMAGHTAERGDAFACDQLESTLGIEVVHHDDLPAGPDVPDHDGVAAGGVEERHRQRESRSVPSEKGRRGLVPNRSCARVLMKKRLIKLVHMLRCVPTAPLGRPVVPEV